jgi:hypothetical protein
MALARGVPSLQKKCICESLFVRADKVCEVLAEGQYEARAATIEALRGDWKGHGTFMKMWPSSVSMVQDVRASHT